MVASYNDRFEVTWRDPRDAASIWAIDRIHFAQPLPPLSQDFFETLVGISWETRSVFANGYLFMQDFKPPPTPDEVKQRGAFEIWNEKYLPLVKQICAEVRAPDYDAMSAVEIAGLLPDAFRRVSEAFRYPTVIASEFMAPALALTLFCEQVLGDDGPVLATTLLQGFANESTAAGAGLGNLAQLAAKHPRLAEALKSGRSEGIEAQEGGAEFLQRFHVYLDTYGWRADEWCLLHVPTWAEAPETPLRLIADYLRDPGHSPALSHERSVNVRLDAARQIEARLPVDQREQFQAMLDKALRHVPFSEERALWQLIAIGSARVPLLALGRKLVEAGAIDQAEDMFFLSLTELTGLAATPRSMRDAVAQRRTEYEHDRTLTPPQSIGAPLIVGDRPSQSQIIHRYFFGTVPPPSDATVIRGSGASQGIVSGKARIVTSLTEASRLQPGEILVCRTTAPPWTPLFAIAAGVVTETGGILSHSAICAREYAIPCVVGTQVATSRIQDGANVTVDGTKGTVTIDD